MGRSPKVLAPGEEKLVINALRGIKGKRIGAKDILEIEGRYSLIDLRNMARAASISHLGDKEQLCRRLIEAGKIK